MKLRRRIAFWLVPDMRPTDGNAVFRIGPGGYVRGCDIANVDGQVVITRAGERPAEIGTIHIRTSDPRT